MKNRFRKVLFILTAASLLSSSAATCFAADGTVKDIFQDGFYGALTGGLVGAAVLAFAHRPGDHLDYLAYGAATGVFAGVTYGVIKSSQALAQVEDGKVKFAIPTIMPDFPDNSVRGKNPLVISAELLRGKF